MYLAKDRALMKGVLTISSLIIVFVVAFVH